MTPVLAFVLPLGVTVVLLLCVILTGRAGRVRIHVPLVASAVLSLAVTIVFAERLGDHYDLEAAGTITAVHLFLAKVTTLGYLVPITSGIQTLRRRCRRRVHAIAAYSIFGLTLVTFATGTWMILAADPL